MPLARAASAIRSAVDPWPIRRSSSEFMVSTSMMLKRPRYPVVAHSGHPTARSNFAPGGMNRASCSGTGASRGSKQALQSRRISRWATTPRRAEAIL
jgi:hypothetical protein